jgi:hypothetical protein
MSTSAAVCGGARGGGAVAYGDGAGVWVVGYVCMCGGVPPLVNEGGFQKRVPFMLVW